MFRWAALFRDIIHWLTFRLRRQSQMVKARPVEELTIAVTHGYSGAVTALLPAPFGIIDSISEILVA